MNDSETGHFIKKTRSLLHDMALIKDTVAITVVANVKGITNTDDYEKHSVITDFFSEAELEEIVLAFRESGFYTEVFTDEIDFMQAVVTNQFNKIPRKNKLVYNTSQKGIGAGRHSLVPAFCKLHHIPFIGSNAYVSCLCRHKYHFNQLLSRFHQHLPKAWLFDQQGKWLLGNKPPEGLKIIIKPVYEAASIGINKDAVFCYTPERDKLLEEYTEIYKQPFAVEEFIEGYEMEVPFIISGGYYCPAPVGISLHGDKYLGDKILSYEEVYDDGYSFYAADELDATLKADILQCTKDSAAILEIEDFGRIDYRVTRNGKFYLTDITTGPHTVHHSSCNFMFNKSGFSHAELMATLAAVAARRYGWI